MSIATQVKELYDRRKYESIVSIFQDVDLENRDEQYWGVKPLSSRWCALMMMFAHAVLEESNEEWLNLRRMLVKAKNALYLCHERIGEDLHWTCVRTHGTGMRIVLSLLEKVASPKNRRLRSSVSSTGKLTAVSALASIRSLTIHLLTV